MGIHCCDQNWGCTTRKPVVFILFLKCQMLLCFYATELCFVFSSIQNEVNQICHGAALLWDSVSSLNNAPCLLLLPTTPNYINILRLAQANRIVLLGLNKTSRLKPGCTSNSGAGFKTYCKWHTCWCHVYLLGLQECNTLTEFVAVAASFSS